jgi:gamma-glutamyl-gamma-aminobutyrate hydrolase PuuD
MSEQPTRRICVVNDYDGLYGRFWSNLGQIVKPYALFLKDPENFDLVCFTGGEDVSPELYGHENLASGCSPERDSHEARFFEIAMDHGIPMTGICRGAQFLNVMLGGTMVQHLKRSHGAGRHMCQANNGEEFLITSAHHQMIVPARTGKILAWADTRLEIKDLAYAGPIEDLSPVLDEDGSVKVVEAIAYPEEKVFGIQGHPEWLGLDEAGPQWVLQKIREICFGEQKDMGASA